MRIFEKQITLIEVPGEVSLTLGVSGCPNNCPGCSWAKLDTEGPEMSLQQFDDILSPLVGMVTCVTFLGGDWCSDLTDFLSVAIAKGFKTCLYTGLDTCDCKGQLDYLKTGDYREELGALDSEKTNQIFINVNTGENLNHLFRKSQRK